MAKRRSRLWRSENTFGGFAGENWGSEDLPVASSSRPRAVRCGPRPSTPSYSTGLGGRGLYVAFGFVFHFGGVDHRFGLQQLGLSLALCLAEQQGIDSHSIN